MNKKFYMLVLFLSLIMVSPPAFAWQKVISIPYYSQTSPDWTGPASAGMILESPVITAHPAYAYKTQPELWTYISTHLNPAWTPLYPGVHTDPYAMRECLKEYDTRPGFTYVIHDTPTYSAIVSQKIVHTIEHYDVPPAVPIDGGLNWVAVLGVDTTSDPSLGPYSINWFLINDPRDPVLGNNRYITYTAWENSGASSVFRHIATPDPFPDNLLKIAVCDPETPGPLKVEAPEMLPRRETVLSPDEAREAAIKGLKKYNLTDKPEFQKAQKRIRFGNPILVKRIAGGLRTDYYIVPLVKRCFFFWKRLTGAVLIDAYSGAFLETSGAKEPVSYSYLTLSLKRAKKVLSKKIRKAEGIKKRDVRVEMPTLTWKPGLSVNPYFPLWETRAVIKGVDTIRYLDFEKNVHPPLYYPSEGK
ncbi:MAG: hypothetical protein ACC630_06645 [Nitrospinota bacterium]